MDDKLKVYVETSFVCYLTGDPTPNARIAADQAYTRQWWDENHERHNVFASQFVADECNVGRVDAVDRRMKMLGAIPFVALDMPAVRRLADKLLSEHALPEGETTDALHIAAASVTGMDYLLTWNCKHMANPYTLPKTIRIVEAAGFRCPLIMTPRTFIENENLEVPNAQR